METELRKHLLTCAAIFGHAQKIENSTLGRKAAGDWRFFTRLESGSTFTVKKHDEIMHWFSENWPASTPWPNDVPRPLKAAA